MLKDGAPRRIKVAACGKVHYSVRAPSLGPSQFLDLFFCTRRYRGRAHVCVDLRATGPTDAHRVKLVTQVFAICRDDHSTRRHLIAYLFGAEMWFSLAHALHLFRDDPQPRVLELCDGNKALWRPRKLAITNPLWWKEVPRGLHTGRGHPRGIGRGKGQRTTNIRSEGERSWVRPFALGGGVASAVQWERNRHESELTLVQAMGRNDVQYPL